MRVMASDRVPVMRVNNLVGELDFFLFLSKRWKDIAILIFGQFF